MKEKILVGMVAAMLPLGASAYLQVSASDDDLGQLCFSDDDGAELYLISCGPVSDMQEILGGLGDGDFASEPDCPDSAADVMFGQGCLVGVADDKKYICAPVLSDACDWCGMMGYESAQSDWEDAGDNVVRYFEAAGDLYLEEYHCALEGASWNHVYGCAEGYYQSSGSDANMTCSRCPSSGGVYGTNDVGDTSITTCYIPAGSVRTFTDDAGSGTEYNEDDCFYVK
ncbi:MAG: hypothetical protein IJD69_03035 [Alphaproteobacteria bacterium]|nr:hypothetical protein [Alphaproteobacteria bacterium]